MYTTKESRILKPYRREGCRPGMYVALRQPRSKYKGQKNVSYLVAVHFLYRATNTVYRVDYIDGDCDNNHVWNLKWRTKD